MRAAWFLVVWLFAVQAVATYAKQVSFLAAHRGSSQDRACPPCHGHVEAELERPGFIIASPPSGSKTASQSSSAPGASVSTASASGCHCEPATGEAGDGDLDIDFYPDAPVTLEKVRGANYKAFVREMMRDTDKEVWARSQTMVQRLIALKKAKEELVQMALMPSPEARLARSDNITKELQEVVHNITKAAEKAGSRTQKEEDKLKKMQEKEQAKKGSKAKLFDATSEVEELFYGDGAPEELVESKPMTADPPAPPVFQAQQLLSTASKAEQFALSPVTAEQYDLAPVTEDTVLIHQADAPAKTKAGGAVKFLPVTYVD